MAKLQLRRNNTENKESRNDVIPKKTNRLIAMIFKEDKSCKIILVKNNQYDFVHKGHLYFIEPTAIHVSDNNVRIAFYMEGISTPMSHANVEKKLETVQYKDLNGKIKEKTVTKIKGLKYDSRILQIFTDRKFAEIFTKVTIDKWAFYTFIMLIVVTCLSCGSIVASYFFR